MEIIYLMLVMVVVGGLIGWFTNFLAIKLLFRPFKELNILGFKLQGVIPKRKHDIAINIATTVDEHLISIKDITATMDSIEIENEINKIVSVIVDEKLKKEIVEKFPMAAMFLNDSLMGKIKKFVKDAIEDNKQEFIEIIVAKIEKNVDTKELVKRKIDEFSLERLEELILGLVKSELRHIEFLGGVLGAIIGFFQFIITKVML